MSTPRIVVLDGHTLNPGDLSWDPLRALGDLTVYDRTPPESAVERAGGAQVVLTNKTRLPAEHIAALDEARMIGVLATGYDGVDGASARARGIAVCNVPAYSTDSVAQMVWAHVLNFTHGVAERSADVRSGGWSAQPDFAYWDAPPVELTGMTLGIVGMGRIGKAVARAGLAFGMDVLAHSRTVPDTPPEGVRYVGRAELFAQSDVVSLHCPLTPETRGFVDADLLATMKPTALLINTGRGPLLDEAAVADALHAGRLGGVGLDVLSSEPPAPDNPLLSAPRCAITPHVAWATKAARQRLLDTAVANVAAFLRGAPQNVVN